MLKDFYSPGEIRFTRDEMIWLVMWLPLLERGEWPPDHKETGYTDPKGGRNYRAPFENPAGFAAEVKCRLKTTGEAGEALVDEISNNILDYNELCGPAKRALNYISGIRRRHQTYSQWKATKKYNTYIVKRRK